MNSQLVIKIKAKIMVILKISLYNEIANISHL